MNKLSNSGTKRYFIIALVILSILIFNLVSGARKQEDYYLIALFVAIFLLYFRALNNTATIYYDDGHLIIVRMFRKENISFERIVQIRPKSDTFVFAKRFQAGYQISYLRENEKKASCIFYIDIADSVKLKKFIEKLEISNQSIDIDLNE